MKGVRERRVKFLKDWTWNNYSSVFARCPSSYALIVVRVLACSGSADVR